MIILISRRNILPGTEAKSLQKIEVFYKIALISVQKKFFFDLNIILLMLN